MATFRAGKEDLLRSGVELQQGGAEITAIDAHEQTLSSVEEKSETRCKGITKAHLISCIHWMLTASLVVTVIQMKITVKNSDDTLYTTTFSPFIAPASSAQLSTLIPTGDPTEFPTEFQTSMPASNHPTKEPTNKPTKSPTLQPTISLYESYIGDYKMSAQPTNHGRWLLCDGSYLNVTDYPKLFGIIGYNFGNLSFLFGLPNATDRVIGIDGNINPIGTMKGDETVNLTEANMPPHTHYIGTIGGNLYAQDTWSYLKVADPNSYEYWYTYPNKFKSGNGSGNSTSVNIMQPTVFVGNLFIYAD